MANLPPKIAFFNTQSRSTSFLTTTVNSPVFLTGGTATAFMGTLGTTPIFLTGGSSVSFFNTLGTAPIFLTSNKKVMFIVTPNTGTTKDLVLKIESLEINTDQTQITLTDGTGTYDPLNPTLDPGGFNPETEPTNPYRPKRSQVYLWTVYKLRSRTNSQGYGNNTQTPATQTEKTNVPYIYTLTMPTESISNVNVSIKGIYEMIMIAAPVGESYANYVGNVNLADIAATYPNWYVTRAAILVDPDLINCLNNKRYAFLQSVMCGKCNEEYLEFYGIYVGMLNAMDVGEWDAANEYYDKLKTICTEINCKDNCCDC